MEKLIEAYEQLINPSTFFKGWSIEQFKDWLLYDEYSQKQESPNIDHLNSLLARLEDEEMYELCLVVKNEIQKYENR